jgi:hypothetical protein
MGLEPRQSGDFNVDPTICWLYGIIDIPIEEIGSLSK